MENRGFLKINELMKNNNDEAMLHIIENFKPLMLKKSYYAGRFNEDCFQELNIKLIECIEKFTFTIKEDMVNCLVTNLRWSFLNTQK